jgi:uncharacterized phage-associated protein
MDEDYVRFDRAKLKAATLYVCSRMQPHELGNVKLHKILYFADMLRFADQGEPLTGVDYIKQRFGPIARHLTSVLEELAREGSLRIETRNYYGFEKRDYIALAEPDRSVLGNAGVDLLDHVIAFARERSASELSELSHDVAWRAADMGERIPYAGVFGWAPEEVTDEDQQAALAEARRVRPLIEREVDAR